MVIVSEVRAWTRALIPQLYSQGINPTSYYNKMVKSGTFYRKQTFLRDYREITGLMKHEKAVRSTGKDRYVAKGNMVEMEMKGEHKYRVWADVEYTNKETGVHETKLVSFYSDEYKLTGDWEQEFIDWTVNKSYKADSYISNIQTRNVAHNKGKPY